MKRSCLVPALAIVAGALVVVAAGPGRHADTLVLQSPDGRNTITLRAANDGAVIRLAGPDGVRVLGGGGCGCGPACDCDPCDCGADLEAALREIADYQPDPSGVDLYTQIGLHSLKTARAALARDARRPARAEARP
jgi:hypothetical protein